jgi:hypothetical protein
VRTTGPPRRSGCRRVSFRADLFSCSSNPPARLRSTPEPGLFHTPASCSLRCANDTLQSRSGKPGSLTIEFFNSGCLRETCARKPKHVHQLPATSHGLPATGSRLRAPGSVPCGLWPVACGLWPVARGLRRVAAQSLSPRAVPLRRPRGGMHLQPLFSPYERLANAPTRLVTSRRARGTAWRSGPEISSP